MKRRNTPILSGLLSARAFTTLLFLATTSFAGPPPVEWEPLPQANSISFSADAVGLTTLDDRHFVIDRSTASIQEVSAEEFAKRFAGRIDSKSPLTTSNGKVLTTTNAWCEFREETKHTLSIDGHPLTDQVDPCMSIGAAEMVGANLWLGTWRYGEPSDYWGDGLVVQTSGDGRLVKRLSTKDGLTGDVVRVIRLDPFGKTVWLATNEGINEVDQDLCVARTLFFKEKLDPETGRPKVELAPTRPSPTDRLLPMLFRELQVSNAKAFYEATRSIPAAAQELFMDALDEWHVPQPQNGFVPKEMNVLVPFFIEATRTSRFYRASDGLCAFRDQRAIDFLLQQSAGADWYGGGSPPCLGKFVQAGMVPAQQKKQPAIQK